MTLPPDAPRLRVLLVPDSIHWVTGSLAREISRFNPWIEATILSGPVLARLDKADPGMMGSFDLVHFLCPFASKAWLPRLRFSVPVVTSHHHVSCWADVAHNIDGDGIVTGSVEWAEDLTRRGVDPAKIISIPYGVDTRCFAPPDDEARSSARRRLGFGGAGPVIGFFAKKSSNEFDRKGTRPFAESLIALHAELPNLGVLIVGPGWQDLTAEFRSRGINCKWLRHVEDPRSLPSLYAALDFYWVTSRIEGGPVPLLEAMASGICCLSTPVGLALEAIDSGANGVLLPFDDSAAFASTTLSLWNQPSKRREIGTAARKTMVANMDVAETSRRIADAYAAAVRSFAGRNPGYYAPDVLGMVRQGPGGRPSPSDVIPLSAVGAGDRRAVRLMESVEWAEHLALYHEERLAALKVLLRAWLQSPFSVEPLRSMLRRFLPPALVGRVVGAKHAIHRTRG